MNTLKKFLLLAFLCIFLVACGDNDISSKNKNSIENELEANKKNKMTIWENKDFENNIRILIDKPEGVIYTSDLDAITEINISRNNFQSNLNTSTPLQPVELIYSNELYDLNNFENLKNIHISFTSKANINKFPKLNNCKNIETLIIEMGNISDISNIMKYTRLKKLEIYGNTIDDISYINNLKELENLILFCIGPEVNTITGHDYSDIDLIELSNLSSLKSLYIYNSRIKNTYVLDKFENLESLVLKDTYLKYEDIYSLDNYNLKNIQLCIFEDINYKLDIPFNDTDIFDISKLSNLKNLKELAIEGSVKNIANLKSLETIEITHSNINKDESFNNMERLKNLSLVMTSIENNNIFKSLLNLNSLEIKDCKFDDLKSINMLTNLKKLVILYGELTGDITDYGIFDIKDIQTINNLEHIELKFGNIINSQYLLEFDKLNYLDIKNSNVDNIDILNKLIDNSNIVFIYSN